MSVIVLPHTPVSGQVVPSVGQLANFTTIRDAFNNTAVQTDVAKTIGVAHTFGANILFTDALYDIGQPGATRPRDLHLSRNIVVGGTAAITGAVTLSSTLVVAGASNFTGALTAAGGVFSTSLRDSAAAGTSAIAIREDNANPITFTTDATERMRIASGGQVLIGTTVTTNLEAGGLGLANNKSIRFLNAAGASHLQALSVDTNNFVVLAGASNIDASSTSFVRIPHFSATAQLGANSVYTGIFFMAREGGVTYLVSHHGANRSRVALTDF